MRYGTAKYGVALDDYPTAVSVFRQHIKKEHAGEVANELIDQDGKYCWTCWNLAERVVRHIPGFNMADKSGVWPGALSVLNQKGGTVKVEGADTEAAD